MAKRSWPAPTGPRPSRRAGRVAGGRPMSLAAVVAAAMFVGVLAYAVLGGADFGSGFYDLTAGGGRRGAELRTLIDHSIGPVWEANHVWLIFVLVMWWTGFPKAFAAATTTLFTPFMLALVGIVLRGASFASGSTPPRSHRRSCLARSSPDLL